MLVGGYAVIFHGYNRTTGDLDIWVKPTPINYQKLRKAFSIFGMSVFDMSEQKFLDTDKNDVFSFGNPPVCIEILTKVKGLDFDTTFKKSNNATFDGLNLQIIDLEDLITTKKAVNRNKDKDDIDHLK